MSSILPLKITSFPLSFGKELFDVWQDQRNRVLYYQVNSLVPCISLRRNTLPAG